MGIEKVQIGWTVWKRNGKGEKRMENEQKDEGTSGTRMGQRAWSRCQLERAGVIGTEQVGMGRDRGTGAGADGMRQVPRGPRPLSLPFPTGSHPLLPQPIPARLGHTRSPPGSLWGDQAP